MAAFYTDTMENTIRQAVLISGEMGETKMRGQLCLRSGRSDCLVARRLAQTTEHHSTPVNRSIRRLIDRHKHVTSSATDPAL
jgi:hypothetical protein